VANGVQLATAYISLNVRTDGIKKQVESALNGTSGLGRSHGVKIGQSLSSGIYSGLGSIAFSGSIFAKLEAGAKATALRIGSMMATAIKGALAATGVGLGIAGLGGIAGVLTAGLDRMKTKQAATVQLSLTLSPAEIKKVTDDVQKVVDGIPVSMDQAMASIPKAIQAGIDPSQWVKDIANAAASSGGQSSYEDVSMVMGQVIGKGALLSEEMQQLAERGVDVRWALKQAFGWDDKTLEKNIKNKKVGINELRQAIQKTWGKDGGLAVKMNETISGATGSLKAQIAKLGENFLGAIFGDPNDPNADPAANAAKGIVKVTDGIRDMVAWVSAHKTDIHNFFTKAGDAANALWTGVKKVWEWLGKAKDIAVDVGGKIGEGFTTAKSAVEGMWNKVSDVYGKIKTKLSDIIDDIKKKFDGIFGENGWFSQQFDKLGKIVDRVREVLGLGEATANAAGPGDTTPLNRGPIAPGQTPPLPPGARVVPGTIGPGSGGTLGAPSALLPGGGFNQSAVMGRVPAGRYVPADEYATGDVNKLGDLSLGLGDCTSAIEDLVNIIEGKSTAGRSMATGNAADWATQHGFAPTDKPVPGAFQIGFNGGHMQATLPTGDAFNWGSDSAAAQRGLDGGQGAWFDGATQHYYKRYDTGGRVSGAGTGTSDSIPAMLSNGEHVLTAAEVKKMGGQDAVYAFRNQLRNGGAIRGFAPGGAVDPPDPAKQRELQNQMTQLDNAAELARAKQLEVMQNSEATELQKTQAAIALSQALRAQQNYATDLPTLLTGGSSPDRSLQEELYNTTDNLTLSDLQLEDLKKRKENGDDIPVSQMMEAQQANDQARNARYEAILKAQGGSGGGDKPPPSFLDNLMTNTMGYIPTGGGGEAGTSSLAKMLGMGSQVVNGLIDTGASLANMAVSAAISAGSFGAGAAAGPAAGFGINMAAGELKTLSSFWLGSVPGIAADALVAQLFPIGGPPRVLGYDYTQFNPQLGIMDAANTTIQQMGSKAINDYFKPKNGGATIPQLGGPQQGVPSTSAAPVTPTPVDGSTQKLVGPGDPGFYSPDIQGNINGNPLWDPLNPALGGGAGGGNGGGGSWATGGHVGIYDDGGVLNPGDIAVNKSKTPEKVLTPQQWEAMSKLSVKGSDGPLVQIGSITGFSPEDVADQIQQKQRLAAMRYTGRPYS
jgi:hypothetical protein